MKKVLLLNPPGKHLYIRDYFCSKVSQADYITHPVDLLMLSGTLAAEYDVRVIDAMAGKLSPEEALKAVRNIAPFAIISLFGAVSLEEDLEFASKVREVCPGVKLVGIGDAFRDGGENYLGADSPLDALLLDFTTPDIVSYLNGDHEAANNMLIRTNGKILPARIIPEHRQFDIPLPLHHLFAGYNYRHPFIKSKKFATVLTDYGCPYPCSFCIMGTLGFKIRKADAVIDELKQIRLLGIKEILFHTQTFGANAVAAKELCDKMIREGLDLEWVCFSRVDVVAPDLLELMKKAGCHTIIFGVESGSEEILKKYRKGYSLEQIILTINYCRSIDIETVGTFIIGLPEEDHETMSQTLGLLKTIKLDYASFNVAVPRMNTALRDEAIALGMVDKDFSVMDQSGCSIAMPSKWLTKEEILQYRKKAVSIFYFNPRYIFRRLAKIRTLYDLTRQLKQAVALAKNTWCDK
ncbi:MAG: radical SAM protein [Elusimicrobia bacterium]|nr:radical SAM protein [Elusimicrobiota bacterium]